MSKFSDFKEVIDKWPSRKDFARHVGASIAAVHKMHETDNIRGVYFQNIIEASKRLHGDDAVTADDLCRLAARRLSRDKVEAA